jgi:hypothetical protein
MEMRGETERAKKAAEAAVLMFRNLEASAAAAEAKATASAAAKRPASKSGAARPATKKPARRA